MASSTQQSASPEQGDLFAVHGVDMASAARSAIYEALANSTAGTDFEILVQMTPIADLDDALRELHALESTADPTVVASKLDRYCSSVLLVADPDCTVPHSDSTRDIFRPALASGAKVFVAVSLARLVVTNYAPFEDARFRESTAKLFDQTLADLYPRLRIGSQTYEKLSGLAEAVRTAEGDLRAAVETRLELRALAEYRKAVSAALRSLLVSRFISPFLPRQLLDTNLSVLFNAVGAFAEADGMEFMAAYRQAKEEIDTYAEVVEAHSGQYATTFLGEIASRLREAVDQYVTRSPLGQHASVEIGLTEKRYPLHEQGVDVTVQLVVTNAGPGQAQDVSLIVDEAAGVQISSNAVGLGSLPPSRVVVPVKAQTDGGQTSALLTTTVHWTNTDGTVGRAESLVELPAQRADVPWDELAHAQPYTLLPVTREADLVGRAEILNRLVAVASSAAAMSNATISGQRRVGKTSIANALADRLLGSEERFLCPTVLVGPYGGRTIDETIAKLGKAICRAITKGLPGGGPQRLISRKGSQLFLNSSTTSRSSGRTQSSS